VSELKAVREMINPLILVQWIIYVWLIRLAAPANVPVVPLCLPEAVALKSSSYQLGISFHHFKKHLMLILVHITRRSCVSHHNLPVSWQLTYLKIVFLTSYISLGSLKFIISAGLW
jgi:hypothetical protein